jgi:hypothetical protein
MSQEKKNKTEVHYKVAKIQAGVVAFVMAVISGLSIFIATAWLLIKGGENVGQHLNLLGQYFPGYSVTWIGSFVGLCYGIIVGGIAGWLISFIYNRIVDIKAR